MPKRIVRKSPTENNIYSKIRQIIESARSGIARAVNTEMVQAYWLIGREIVEEEQKGKRRAKYGEAMIEDLSDRLIREYGNGWSTSHLWHVRQFYLTFQDRCLKIPHTLCAESGFLHTLRPELAWSHYRILMRVEKPEARSFYEIECVKNHWSVRELERQKGSLLFERLSLSKDKKEAVVRYTLPKKNKQIFASKYKLYLPTEQELKTELKREKLIFEDAKI